MWREENITRGNRGNGKVNRDQEKKRAMRKDKK